MSKFISIEALFQAGQNVAPKYVVKGIGGESTYDSLSQVLDAFGFEREDEQEMDRLLDAFGFRTDDERESSSLVNEMPTQNVEDWINASIFAHDQTDGKENWGSIEHHGDPRHTEKWLKLYQEYIHKNYAPIARSAHQVVEDAFVLAPDTHDKGRIEKVARIIIATPSPDGNIQTSTTILPHAPHLSFAERMLTWTKMPAEQEMSQRLVLLAAEQMEEADEPQFAH